MSFEQIVLDSNQISRLHSMGGNEFVLKMIETMLDFVPGVIAKGRVALAAGDYKGVAFAAHTIRSSAGNIGATDLFQFATELEQTCGKNDGAKITEDFSKLEQLYAATEVVLLKLKEKLQ